MDTGRRRTAGNALELLNYGGYAASLAATARIGIRVEREGLNAERFAGITVSNQEIVDFVGAHPDLLDAIKFAQSVYQEADIPSLGVAAYAYWLMALLDERVAQNFWIQARDTVGLEPESPILILTRRFAIARRQR